jgi:hypothetical protein
MSSMKKQTNAERILMLTELKKDLATLHAAIVCELGMIPPKGVTFRYAQEVVCALLDDGELRILNETSLDPDRHTRLLHTELSSITDEELPLSGDVEFLTGILVAVWKAIESYHSSLPLLASEAKYFAQTIRAQD